MGLLNSYQRVLYVDIDVHHGDGVENAFMYSNRVYTLSVHRYGPGFFPGSGAASECGKGRGYGFCTNIPIKHQAGGHEWLDLIIQELDAICLDFRPEVIVACCGADVLSTDPHQALNVCSDAYVRAIEKITSLKLPTIFLGGGTRIEVKSFLIQHFRRL